MVGDWLIQVIANVPAVRQVEAHHLHEFALRADTLKEHNELQLEEHHGVNGWATQGSCIIFFNQLTHKTQIQFCFDMAIKVLLGDKAFQRYGGVLFEALHFMT